MKCKTTTGRVAQTTHSSLIIWGLIRMSPAYVCAGGLKQQQQQEELFKIKFAFIRSRSFELNQAICAYAIHMCLGM